MPRRPRKNAFVSVCRKDDATASRDHWVQEFRGALATGGLVVANAACARLVQGQSRLLESAPLKIAQNLFQGASLLDFEPERYWRLALRAKHLLQLRPDNLPAQFEHLQRALECDDEMLRRVIEKYPALLLIAPDTLERNISSIMAMAGVTRDRVLSAARRGPQILCMSPATLNANVHGSAEALGLITSDFANCALKQPPLFYMLPSTLQCNIATAAAALDLSVAEFVGFAQRQPSLFYARSETLARKRVLLEALVRDYQINLKLRDALETFPGAICFSEETLEARHALVRMRGDTITLGYILSMPAARLQALLMQTQIH